MTDTYLERLGYPADGQYSEWRPQNVSSVAYQAAIRVKSGPGLLFGFTVYNSKASAQFVQVFDLTDAPANGAVPVVVFSVGASSNFASAWIPPRSFLNGCYIANSSTGPTLTAGSADCYFDVQFL